MRAELLSLNYIESPVRLVIDSFSVNMSDAKLAF